MAEEHNETIQRARQSLVQQSQGVSCRINPFHLLKSLFNNLAHKGPQIAFVRNSNVAGGLIFADLEKSRFVGSFQTKRIMDNSFYIYQFKI